MLCPSRRRGHVELPIKTAVPSGQNMPALRLGVAPNFGGAGGRCHAYTGIARVGMVPRNREKRDMLTRDFVARMHATLPRKRLRYGGPCAGAGHHPRPRASRFQCWLLLTASLYSSQA